MPYKLLSVLLTHECSYILPELHLDDLHFMNGRETCPKHRATGTELESVSQAIFRHLITVLHLNLALNSVGISQDVLIFFFIYKVSPEVGWVPGDQCLKNNSKGVAVLQASALRLCFMGSERGILSML